MLLLHSSRPHYNIRILSVVPTAVNLHVIIRQLLKNAKKHQKQKNSSKNRKTFIKIQKFHLYHIVRSSSICYI